MSGAITAVAAIGAAVGGIYSARQQAKAQKQASAVQADAQNKANQLQAEANNTANQQNNRAAKATVHNFDVTDNTLASSGIVNSNGALGFGKGSYNLGSNNALGAIGDDDSII